VTCPTASHGFPPIPTTVGIPTHGGAYKSTPWDSGVVPKAISAEKDQAASTQREAS